MRPVYDKFIDGSPLTDEDLEEGIKFFQDLTDKLSCLGPVFQLSANEARRVLFAFEGFKRAREEHN